MHADGMSKTRKRRLHETVTSVTEYTRFPGIAGCQVKMLTGFRCGSDHIATTSNLAVATDRLHTAFAFVGLTDYFNLSVCLFHAMFGGTPRALSFANYRPTEKFAPGYAQEDALQAVSFNDDPLDAALYEEARTVFVARLQQYGFDVPAELLLPATRGVSPGAEPAPPRPSGAAPWAGPFAVALSALLLLLLYALSPVGRCGRSMFRFSLGPLVRW
eukprot:m.1194043 g.1194043  ORF g.1194043 m.1194043 type:complete len:216 (+) comp24559_c0_seq9:1331-1978(+)